MKVTKSDRGFEFLEHPKYLPEERGDCDQLASQSSAVGDYDDAMERPGTSFLWIGEDHHLDRKEVLQLVKHLNAWLDTGKLSLKK